MTVYVFDRCDETRARAAEVARSLSLSLARAEMMSPLLVPLRRLYARTIYHYTATGEKKIT